MRKEIQTEGSETRCHVFSAQLPLFLANFRAQMIQMLTPLEDQPAVNDWNLLVQRSFDLKKEKSDICYVHPYLGRCSNLKNHIFQVETINKSPHFLGV